jgi:hypothetical protein
MSDTAANINTYSSPSVASDRSVEIRAAMSLSNLVILPPQGVNLEEPLTPVATALPVLADTDDAKEAPTSPDMDIDIGELAETGHVGEVGDTVDANMSEDEKMVTDSSPAVNGSDASPVADGADPSAVVKREFICMNDVGSKCQTGQYTLNLSRKVISDHFGRNKACTRIVKDWPLFCRKHYQRATYNVRQWQDRKVQLIVNQFDVIEEQFPGTKYEIVFKKSEEQRLNTFSRKVAQGMNPDEAESFVVARDNKHFEAPIKVIRELAQDHLGDDKTLEEVKQTCYLIQEMLDKGETKAVPAIEFLPQIDAEGNTYDKATGSSPRKAKSPKTPRVTKKGGIQKPSPKKARKAKA